MYISTNKSDKLENSQDNSILFILIYPYILKISINNLRAYSHFWNFIEKNLIYMKEYWVFENKYESGNKQCRNRGKSARMFHLVTHGASHHSLWNICFYNFPNEYLHADVTKWDKNLDIVFVWSWYKPIYTEWKFFGSRWKFSRDP